MTENPFQLPGYQVIGMQDTGVAFDVRWPHQAHLDVKTKWLVQCERAIAVSGESLYLFNSCLGCGRAAAVMKKALNLSDQGFFKT